MRIHHRILTATTVLLLSAGSLFAEKLDRTSFVYRGGDCSAASFSRGSNEGNNFTGVLSGVSVYGINGPKSNDVEAVKARNSDLVQNSGCFTTVEAIQKKGGTVKAKPVKDTGRDHQEISGLTPDQLVAVFGNGNQRWKAR